METNVRRIPSVAHVLAVASCKGGVGKTTVAVNLAFALRRAGARVGLFDADLYGPNVPLMLGIRTGRASFPFSGTDRKGRSHGFIPLGRTEAEPYIRPLKRYGIHVMSVGFWFADTDAVTDNPTLGAHMIRQTLQDVAWDPLDFLILDFPPGTGEPQQTLLGAVGIDGVLLVTTPQEMALMDTGRSVGFFRSFAVPLLGVVENMGHAVCPHCGGIITVFDGPADAGRALDGVPVLGRIPLDPALGRRIDADHPLLQPRLDSPQALAFRSLAAAVLGLFPGTVRPTP